MQVESSLTKSQLELDLRRVLSVCHTTRASRRQEQKGREHFFLGEDEFLAKSAHGDLFECAEIHGKLHGTSRAAIEQRVAGLCALAESGLPWRARAPV